MRIAPRAAAACVIAVMPAIAQAETHRFIPKDFYNTFSGAHPVALRIKPGDRVITKTIDAGGVDWNGNAMPVRGNPETGPFFVEGAEPGDMLVVTLEKIETNRTSAGSAACWRLIPSIRRPSPRAPTASCTA